VAVEVRGVAASAVVTAPTVREEHPRDRAAVRALHLSAFGDHGLVVADLVDALRPAVTRGEGLSLVAEEDGAVVGHVMCTPSLLDAPRRLVAVQVLSPLAVAPLQQRRGVGAALVRAALRVLAERGVPVVFLEGDPRYYARLGFRAGGSQGFRTPSLRIPDAAFQALPLPAHEPWMTGTLVYAEAFWRHDAVGLRDPGPSPSVTAPPWTIPGLPRLAWHGEPAVSDYDAHAHRLSITAPAGTDWSNDPLTGERTASAPALLFEPEGDFALSARVRTAFAGVFDAGVLCLWQSEDQWAKLCFEHSPQRRGMVVSVVTRGSSDDANSVLVDGDAVHLRVVRTGRAYAFHHSLDGSTWHVVRLFRLGDGTAPVRAGFLAQAPDATACTSTFEAIHLSSRVPTDLRDGT
jgi:putative acetyltransferase